MSGKTYLVTMMFGPVQGFIAAARRTRDLWFGSWLLSEASKAGAKGLVDLASEGKAEVELIFPAVTDPSKLDPKSELSVANKIVARVVTDNPADCVAAAKDAATKRWEQMASDCLAKFGKSYQTYIDIDVWKDQVTDMVECYGAWVELGQEYGESLERLNVLLNARKATRNFRPAAVKGEARGYGLWKSSLDGARESVLKSEIRDDMRKRFDHVRKRFGIGAGERLEHLDTPGLVKRVLGQSRPFAALARVACDPWIQLVTDKASDLFGQLCDCHDRLVRSGLVSRSREYTVFPYDGQLVYDFRLVEVQRKPDTYLFLRERKLLERLEAVLQAIKDRKIPKPEPYVALLLADGDRMGRFLSHKPTLGQHQDFHKNVSSKLADFATMAPQSVKKHSGQCVYAGGDDVLAFLPAARALGCAEELARIFEKMMAAVAPEVAAAQRPTFSVGLAFGHIMTPLSTLRARAKDAERAAKEKGEGKKDAPHLQPRNALGVVIAPRSGAPLALRGRWDDTVGQVFEDRRGLAARLDYWAEQFAADVSREPSTDPSTENSEGNEPTKKPVLPDRAAYQLRELAHELALVPEALQRGTAIGSSQR